MNQPKSMKDTGLGVGRIFRLAHPTQYRNCFSRTLNNMSQVGEKTSLLLTLDLPIH